MKKKKPKILIIADGYPTNKNVLTGLFVKQQTDDIINKKPDWDISVYYNPFFSIFSNTLNKRSIFWSALKWFMQIICFIPVLFKKYDLVHAHRFFLPVMNGVLYKFIHKVPLIVTSHGIMKIRKMYNRKWISRMFNYCDKIIAVNQEMKKEFVEQFSLKDNIVDVISCGVDFNEFDKVKIRKDIKNENTNEITLGFVGDYSNNKRPFLFLKCIEALSDNNDLKCIMIGGGVLQEEIEDYVREHQLPVKVFGTIPHKELLYYYNHFDLLIFPSASETFGIVGIEALYFNVPVISSNVGGKKDYIKDGINGFLFEKDNLRDLIYMTEQIISDKKRLNEMKIHAGNSVKNYSNLLVADRIIKVYKEFMEQ